MDHNELTTDTLKIVDTLPEANRAGVIRVLKTDITVSLTRAAWAHVVGRLDGTLLRTDFSEEDQAYTRAINESIERQAEVPPPTAQD